jgi:hypothetical protein
MIHIADIFQQRNPCDFHTFILNEQILLIIGPDLDGHPVINWQCITDTVAYSSKIDDVALPIINHFERQYCDFKDPTPINKETIIDWNYTHILQNNVVLYNGKQLQQVKHWNFQITWADLCSKLLPMSVGNLIFPINNLSLYATVENDNF